METKQHASEQPTDHGRNQKGNKNMCRNMKMKHDNPKPMEFHKSSAKREIHSNISLPQERR